MVFLKDIVSNNDSLNLGCALVDLGDSSVSIVTFGWHIRYVAHAAKNLNRLVSYERGRFGGQQFSHRCFLNKA